MIFNNKTRRKKQFSKAFKLLNYPFDIFKKVKKQNKH